MVDDSGTLLLALRDLGDEIDASAPATGAAGDPVAAAVDRIRAAALPVSAQAPATAPTPADQMRSRPLGSLPRRRVRSAAGAMDQGATTRRSAAAGAASGRGATWRRSGTAGTASAQGMRWRPSRRVVGAVAAGVLALAGVVAAPGPRGAVARLLGLGGVRVELTDELPAGAPGTQGLGERIDVETALDRAPAPLVPAGTGLGPPSAAFAGLPEGGVSLVWSARAGLPPLEPADPDGAGLVVTAFPTGAGGRLDKRGAAVDSVTVGDSPGLWISGPPHDVSVLGPDGEPVPGALRLARNTLLWEVGGVTYRLESALDQATAVALAEAIG